VATIFCVLTDISCRIHDRGCSCAQERGCTERTSEVHAITCDGPCPPPTHSARVRTPTGPRDDRGQSRQHTRRRRRTSRSPSASLPRPHHLFNVIERCRFLSSRLGGSTVPLQPSIMQRCRFAALNVLPTHSPAPPNGVSRGNELRSPVLTRACPGATLLASMQVDGPCQPCSSRPCPAKQSIATFPRNSRPRRLQLAHPLPTPICSACITRRWRLLGKPTLRAPSAPLSPSPSASPSQRHQAQRPCRARWLQLAIPRPATRRHARSAGRSRTRDERTARRLT